MSRTIAIVCAFLCFALPAAPSHAAEADSTGMDWSRVPEYRIVPGDVLNLNFGPSPEQPWEDVVRELTVRPDGRISVFPVGDVVAAGRSPRELESALVQLLSSELRDPRVVVELAKMTANKVHVLGQVRNPGSYEAEPFLTLTQAVAAAGGFDDDASRNSVLVFRRDGARTVMAARVKFDDAVKRNDLSADLPLSRFDIVYVPRSTVGNISIFAQRLFGSAQLGLSASLIGWELFNLDRVFISPALR